MQNKIPEDYFKKFPDKLNEKILLLKDELKTNAPTLYKIGKQSPYLIPENYFESNPKRIKQKPVRKILSLRLVSGIAAAVVLMLGVFLSSQQFNLEASENTLASIDEQELLEYIDNNIDEFDMDILSDLTLESTTDFDNISVSDLEYFIDQDFDLELIDLKDL